jgi:hypothetical protein
MIFWIIGAMFTYGLMMFNSDGSRIGGFEAIHTLVLAICIWPIMLGVCVADILRDKEKP